MRLYNNVVLTVIDTCLIVLVYSAYYGQRQVYVQGGKISVEGRVSILGPVTVQGKVAIDKPIKAKADSATKSCPSGENRPSSPVVPRRRQRRRSRKSALERTRTARKRLRAGTTR